MNRSQLAQFVAENLNGRGYVGKPHWESLTSSNGVQELQQILFPRYESVLNSAHQELLKAVQNTPLKPVKSNSYDSVVRIGAPEDLTDDDRQLMRSCLEAFVPWKKGPFRYFGIDIDSEWRSDLKWDRIEPHLDSMENKVVCDIGCNNGYFMYRMLAHNPAFVLGMEPVPRHWLAFQMSQTYLRESQVMLELLGAEHMDWFEDRFDTIFCLGILYHHTDPVGLLRKMRKALKKNGQLIVDCQGIPGDESVALTPAGRYAQARGIWFLPTLSCLQNWVQRAGFTQSEVIYNAPLDSEEQRTTNWAPVKSLKDFLDPEDPEKTVEGYPAPWRFYLKIK